jgi:hypothetical protein
VVLAHLWACLIRAQILHAIRMDVAWRADADVCEVAVPLVLDARSDGWASFGPPVVW